MTDRAERERVWLDEDVGHEVGNHNKRLQGAVPHILRDLYQIIEAKTGTISKMEAPEVYLLEAREEGADVPADVVEEVALQLQRHQFRCLLYRSHVDNKGTTDQVLGEIWDEAVV